MMPPAFCQQSLPAHQTMSPPETKTTLFIHIRRRRFRWRHLRWDWGQWWWDEFGQEWYWLWDHHS